MSRFRPMAATQAGRGGGDCREGEAGQRARERQLLRESERGLGRKVPGNDASSPPPQA